MIFIAVIYVVLAIIAMKLDVNFINENTIKLDIILAIVFIILLSLSKKKFKDKKFAAGCSREVIKHGAEMLGWEIDQVLGETLNAMKEAEDHINQELMNF